MCGVARGPCEMSLRIIMFFVSTYTPNVTTVTQLSRTPRTLNRCVLLYNIFRSILPGTYCIITRYVTYKAGLATVIMLSSQSRRFGFYDGRYGTVYVELAPQLMCTRYVCGQPQGGKTALRTVLLPGHAFHCDRKYNTHLDSGINIKRILHSHQSGICLLYTSDAADE